MSNLLMNIRLACESDLLALATLFQQTVLENAPEYYTRIQTEAWVSSALNAEKFRQFILGTTTFVATDDAEVLGFAGVSAEGYVSSVYVRCDRLRQGIGSALMQTVLTYAQDQKINRLYAEASEFSLGLFQKFGFRLYDTEVVERQNVTFHRYLVEKYFEESRDIGLRSIGKSGGDMPS